MIFPVADHCPMTRGPLCIDARYPALSEMTSNDRPIGDQNSVGLI